MKVILNKPHEHAGIKHAQGAEIDVDSSTAAWLEKHGVISSLPQAEEPKQKLFNRKEKDNV